MIMMDDSDNNNKDDDNGSIEEPGAGGEKEEEGGGYPRSTPHLIQPSSSSYPRAGEGGGSVEFIGQGESGHHQWVGRVGGIGGSPPDLDLQSHDLFEPRGSGGEEATAALTFYACDDDLNDLHKTQRVGSSGSGWAVVDEEEEEDVHQKGVNLNLHLGHVPDPSAAGQFATGGMMMDYHSQSRGDDGDKPAADESRSLRLYDQQQQLLLEQEEEEDPPSSSLHSSSAGGGYRQQEEKKKKRPEVAPTPISSQKEEEESGALDCKMMEEDEDNIPPNNPHVEISHQQHHHFQEVVGGPPQPPSTSTLLQPLPQRPPHHPRQFHGLPLYYSGIGVGVGNPSAAVAAVPQKPRLDPPPHSTATTSTKVPKQFAKYEQTRVVALKKKDKTLALTPHQLQQQQQQQNKESPPSSHLYTPPKSPRSISVIHQNPNHSAGSPQLVQGGGIHLNPIPQRFHHQTLLRNPSSAPPSPPFIINPSGPPRPRPPPPALALLPPPTLPGLSTGSSDSPCPRPPRKKYTRRKNIGFEFETIAQQLQLMGQGQGHHVTPAPGSFSPQPRPLNLNSAAGAASYVQTHLPPFNQSFNISHSQSESGLLPSCSGSKATATGTTPDQLYQMGQQYGQQIQQCEQERMTISTESFPLPPPPPHQPQPITSPAKEQKKRAPRRRQSKEKQQSNKKMGDVDPTPTRKQNSKKVKAVTLICTPLPLESNINKPKEFSKSSTTPQILEELMAAKKIKQGQRRRRDSDKSCSSPVATPTPPTADSADPHPSTTSSSWVTTTPEKSSITTESQPPQASHLINSSKEEEDIQRSRVHHQMPNPSSIPTTATPTHLNLTTNGFGLEGAMQDIRLSSVSTNPNSSNNTLTLTNQHQNLFQGDVVMRIEGGKENNLSSSADPIQMEATDSLQPQPQIGESFLLNDEFASEPLIKATSSTSTAGVSILVKKRGRGGGGTSTKKKMPLAKNRKIRGGRGKQEEEPGLSPEKKAPDPRKWFPSPQEQKELYANSSFIVDAVKVGRPPMDVILYRILSSDDAGPVILQKYEPINLSGRELHKATGMMVALDAKDKHFFGRYHPVYCLKIIDSEKISVVQYLNVDRITPNLLKIRETNHLFSTFRTVLDLIFREVIFGEGCIQERIRKDSPKFDEFYKTAWDMCDKECQDRVNELMNVARLPEGFIKPFCFYPSLRFNRLDRLPLHKQETTSGSSYSKKEKKQSCGACVKRVSRTAIYNTSFKRVRYDPISFQREPQNASADNATEQLAKDEDRYLCGTCKTLIQFIWKLLHHKWYIYANIRGYVADLVMEIDPEEEKLDPDQTMDSLLKDYEWLGKTFLEFQVLLAETDKEIKSLREENKRRPYSRSVGGSKIGGN